MVKNFKYLLPAAIFLLFASNTLAEAPEYLNATNPIGEDLTDIPSSIDEIGDMKALDEDVLLLEGIIQPTGISFIDDATYQFKPRLFYLYRDNGDGSKSEALALGGSFGLQSGYWNEWVRIGLTGYTSQKLYGPDDRDGTGLLQEGQEGYTALGEAYAELLVGEQNLRLGLQRFDLPYMNSSDILMTPNTFEAYAITSKVIPRLELVAGHVPRIKIRTNTNFEYMSKQAGVENGNDGVTLVGGRYRFADEFQVGGINLYGWNVLSRSMSHSK